MVSLEPVTKNAPPVGRLRDTLAEVFGTDPVQFWVGPTPCTLRRIVRLFEMQLPSETHEKVFSNPA